MAAAQNPVPFISLPLRPDAVKPGSAGFTLAVNGTGFVPGAVVKWNGRSRTTTFVSSSQLKASILTSDVAQIGTASVTVFNPTPGGGTSNVAFFAVTPPTSSVPLHLTTTFGTFVAGSTAVGDFNGDGKPDLVVAGDPYLAVLVGNGDGTFRTAATYSFPCCGAGVAVGDFNGDGKLDMVVASGGVDTCWATATGPSDPAQATTPLPAPCR